ncbi:MAG: 23S rRNA (uridine(2552)-2'-O)-methyltransferase RlmE [Woeseiaceae bacterium]|nr:23S rRNA (uridine(2552)-2'-O)-methyltransferase RlmE [Woeseiaceae bacterium]
MSKPRRSGGSWRDRQERDPYVKKARAEGWRSRAVYKLQQIDEKDRLLKPGMQIVDLGSAPGSWSQYVTETMNTRAHIVAVDLLPMDTLPNVDFIQGDFRDESTLDAIIEALDGEKADLVMSDMAPNISGNRAVDQPRSMYLVELALDICNDVLKPGGAFVTKLFQGEGADAFIALAKSRFEKTRVFKPKASRAGSREVYLVAKGYKPPA